MLNVDLSTAWSSGLRTASANAGFVLDESSIVAVSTYVVYLAVTLVVGGFVLLVAGDRVRRLETRIRQSTLRAAGLGASGIIVGVSAVSLVVAFLRVIVDPFAGSLAVVLLVPGFVVPLVLFGSTVVGGILAGSWLLRQLTAEPAPNLWAALVVGAVTVNIAYLLPGVNIIVGLAVLTLPLGGLLDCWSNRR